MTTNLPVALTAGLTAEQVGKRLGVLAQAAAAETAERERPAREAAAEVERARRADERVTERELLTACARAVAVACRALSLDEREDMAAHLAETIARKAGQIAAPAHVRGDERAPHDWTPPRRLVGHGYLTRRAAYLWARERERLIAGRADARPSMLDESRMAGALSLNVNGTLESEDPDTRDGHGTASILGAAADAAGHPAPAPENVDAPRVCETLGITATAADAMRAALSGWGSALDMARALNVSHASARKRLQRGRDAIRARYPDPAALVVALGDALADAPDPERVAERVRLGAAERAAGDAVTAVSRSARPSGRGALGAGETFPASGGRGRPADVLAYIDRMTWRASGLPATRRATRRNWRGYLRPTGAGILATATLRGHVGQVTGTGAPMATFTERASVEAPFPAPVTRDRLIADGWVTPSA